MSKKIMEKTEKCKKKIQLPAISPIDTTTILNDFFSVFPKCVGVRVQCFVLN